MAKCNLVTGMLLNCSSVLWKICLSSCKTLHWVHQLVCWLCLSAVWCWGSSTEWVFRALSLWKQLNVEQRLCWTLVWSYTVWCTAHVVCEYSLQPLVTATVPGLLPVTQAPSRVYKWALQTTAHHWRLQSVCLQVGGLLQVRVCPLLVIIKLITSYVVCISQYFLASKGTFRPSQTAETQLNLRLIQYTEWSILIRGSAIKRLCDL